MNLPKIRHLAARGFSLVEVTLAMGIAALGLVAILGMMPQGLEMSRKTAELSVHRQINEQIINNLNQKRWADLAPTAPTVSKLLRYYDDQGLETTAGAPTQVIVAQVAVQRLDNARALPAGSLAEPYLVRAVVKIATTTNPDFNFDDIQNRKNYVTTTHYLAKTK